ncbi:hypothetical protein CPT03_21910 [Pedobacter ginsengisoli]|uniref:Uncharacterized protein n=1 Tax=Pedobacter ginsengisoli TaxID=363852 RepID=A0A2D1UBG4_9SPHI|nr:hypothetical protein CPT03_21910 [Pedobacter ginsengisoli]
MKVSGNALKWRDSCVVYSDPQVSHTEKSGGFINCEAFNKDSKAFHELLRLLIAKNDDRLHVGRLSQAAKPS